MAGTIFFFFSKHQSGHLYATFTTSAEMGSDVKSILHVRERERERERERGGLSSTTVVSFT